MKVALLGAELEENLGLRYMAAALESNGHQAGLVPFNVESDIPVVVEQVLTLSPEIVGLSMVFTGRAREFCRLAQTLRDKGYRGYIIAGGHFASLNCRQLLKDFPAFDAVGLGEGEEIICSLAENLKDPSGVSGLCYRRPDGAISLNPSKGNPGNLDILAFPKRTTFHEYFGQRIASILSTRGCYRDCAFCSINAWYKQGGGKKFRLRSLDNLMAEMQELYFQHDIRIFNFQDDNFFHPDNDTALERFKALRDGLKQRGVKGIAIAVKARPDSITADAIKVLDDLGLFRVFLGVENASESGLRNLNRKCQVHQILNALQVLNDFDVHIAYNLLMFEPDTVMPEILVNLRFMERHIENPFNFCRAEVYAGTGLEAKLRAENRLLGDYFGFDYRIKDPRAEAFHQIANYAFFNRNFSDFGLHYFNMQVDFYFQLLRRFYPEVLSQGLRASVRNFIKATNLDTYSFLCQIFDFVTAIDPADLVLIQGYARELRQKVDYMSSKLKAEGENILHRLEKSYEYRGRGPHLAPAFTAPLSPFDFSQPTPYSGPGSLGEIDFLSPVRGGNGPGLGIGPAALPYSEYRRQLSQPSEERG